MLWSEGDVLKEEIKDLQRIVDADNALLEVEHSPEKRLHLVREVGALQQKIDRLRERIDNSGVD
jgi:hypothetical protein